MTARLIRSRAIMSTEQVDAVAVGINLATQKLYEFAEAEWPHLASR